MEKKQMEMQDLRKEARFIRVAKNGKHPVDAKWFSETHYTYDAPQIQEWISNGGNVGMILGDDGLVCVDVDTKESNVLQKLPGTLLQETPSGFHLFYRTNEVTGRTILQRTDYETSIRGEKTFVVISPSVINKQRYTFCSEENEITWISKRELVLLLEQHGPKKSVVEPTHGHYKDELRMVLEECTGWDNEEIDN